MISSTAAFDGAHTKTFYEGSSQHNTIDKIPCKVWVFPVPGGPWIKKMLEGGMIEIYLKASFCEELYYFSLFQSHHFIGWSSDKSDLGN